MAILQRERDDRAIPGETPAARAGRTGLTRRSPVRDATPASAMATGLVMVASPCRVMSIGSN
jgi:hypothetical protein